MKTNYLWIQTTYVNKLNTYKQANYLPEQTTCRRKLYITANNKQLMKTNITTQKNKKKVTAYEN